MLHLLRCAADDGLAVSRLFTGFSYLGAQCGRDKIVAMSHTYRCNTTYQQQSLSDFGQGYAILKCYNHLICLWCICSCIHFVLLFHAAKIPIYWNIACSAITCFAGICCISPSEFCTMTHSSCKAFSCNIRFSANRKPSSILSCSSNISSSDMAQFRLSEAVVLPAPLQPPMMYNILSISNCKDTKIIPIGKILYDIILAKQKTPLQ